MSTEQSSPPDATKAFSTTHVDLYDITCDDFLLDTRKAVSSPHISRLENLKKEWRRKRILADSPSSQNVRARTNKILHMQHYMRKDIFKEFVKKEGLTAKALRTVHDVNSEEHFWIRNKPETPQIPVSQNRLTLKKSKSATIGNIHVLRSCLSITSPSQAYQDVVKRTALDRQVSYISLKKLQQATAEKANQERSKELNQKISKMKKSNQGPSKKTNKGPAKKSNQEPSKKSDQGPSKNP